MTMSFDGREKARTEVAKILTCLVIDSDTLEKKTLNLVVPRSCGFDLVKHLLTEDQLEAVITS